MTPIMTAETETIPADIPEDVWIAAQEVAHDVFEADCDLMDTGMSGANPALMIARAILAERERCAKVANLHAKARTAAMTATAAGRLTARSIEFAIRNPTP